MYEITMPKLSDSMEVGKIIHWLVAEGDELHAGDVLAEVESDKATMELECFADGVLAKIAHGDDSEVAVGEVIGLIAEEGEEAQAGEPEASAEEEKPAAREPVHEKPPAIRHEGGHIAISPYAKKLAKEKGIDYATVTGTGPGGRIVAHDVEAAAGGKPIPAAPAPAPERPVAADPLAAAVLERYGLGIASVAGTGPGGQVTLDDAIKALTGQAPAKIKPSPDEELPPLDVEPDEADIEDAPFRMKTLARIVTASKHVIPHFYVTRGADVTELFKRKDELKQKHGATVTHLIMLACVRTLKEHPAVNRSYDRGKIIKWKGINLGLAIDTDDGLTVAVLKNAQDFSLADLVARTRDVVEKARAGKLSAEERKHPTFTITNLGMFDVEHFQPIVNPPSAITLAVASALPAPVIRGESIAIAKVMRLTASCDHRIISGVDAATFLKDLNAALEAPDALIG